MTILEHIQKTYKYAPAKKMTAKVMMNLLKDGKVNEIEFCDVNDADTIKKGPGMWRHLETSGIKSDETFKTLVRAALNDPEATVDTLADFVRVLCVTKMTASNTITSNKRNVVLNSSNEVNQVSERPVTLNFNAAHLHTKNLTNDRDRDFFAAFIRDANNIYVRDTNNSLKILISDKDGNVETKNVDTNFLEYLNKRISDDINLFNQKLTIVTPLLIKNSMGTTATPIEDLFVNGEVPFYILQFIDVIKISVSEWCQETSSYNTTEVGYMVRNKKQLGDPIRNMFVRYMLNNMSKFIDYIDFVNKDLAYFSNDHAELAFMHYDLPNIPKVDMPEYQLQDKVIENLPEKWKKYWENKCERHHLFRVLYFLGAVQDASNKSNQYLSISDNGGTGKSTLAEIIRRYMNRKCDGFVACVGNNILDENNEFSIARAKLWERRLIFINEYDGVSMNTVKAKRLTGGDVIDVNMKFKDGIQIQTKYMRFVAMSNVRQSLKSHADRRRCIPVTFKINHSSKDNFSEQEIDELVNTCDKMMQLAYYYYMNSKLKGTDGSMLVMCPEDEKRYLEGKDLNLTEERRLLKVFSKDDSISDVYSTQDWNDTEEGWDREDLFNECFIEDSNSYITKNEMLEVLTKTAIEKREFNDLFTWNRTGNEISIKSGNELHWNRWTKYLKESRNVVASRKRVGIDLCTVFTGIKLKSNLKRKLTEEWS